MCLRVKWNYWEIIVELPSYIYWVMRVKSLSPVQLFATPWTAECQASMSITNSQTFPKLMSTELVMPSSHLILCHSLLLLPSIFPSIRVFSNELVLLHQVAKVLELKLQHQHQSFQWMISFRIDWFDLLAVQEILKSLLQHHISKASILWWSAFFMVQLPHLDMTTGPLLAFFFIYCLGLSELFFQGTNVF